MPQRHRRGGRRGVCRRRVRRDGRRCRCRWLVARRRRWRGGLVPVRRGRRSRRRRGNRGSVSRARRCCCRRGRGRGLVPSGRCRRRRGRGGLGLVAVSRGDRRWWLVSSLWCGRHRRLVGGGDGLPQMERSYRQADRRTNGRMGGWADEQKGRKTKETNTQRESKRKTGGVGFVHDVDHARAEASTQPVPASTSVVPVMMFQRPRTTRPTFVWSSQTPTKRRFVGCNDHDIKIKPTYHTA